MKKNLFIIAVFAVIFAGCNNGPRQKTKAVILIDKTEKDSVEAMTGNEALELIDGNGQITLTEVNAVTLNPQEVVRLKYDPENTKSQRDRKEKAFKNRFEESATLFFKPSTKPSPLSEIYRPVCENIRALRDADVDKKILVIMSDMTENSAYGNFYRDTANYGSIKKRLTASGDSLVKNSDVEVIILFNPKNNPGKQAQFDKSMRVWRKLFADAEIEFSIKAKL